MDTLTSTEVAEGAKVHPHTVRKLADRGLIAVRKDINGHRRFSPEVVQKIKQLYAREVDDDRG